jgi:hypothetical protein
MTFVRFVDQKHICAAYKEVIILFKDLRISSGKQGNPAWKLSESLLVKAKAVPANLGRQECAPRHSMGEGSVHC